MHYHFKVQKKEGFYWAKCIELPECSTQASTYIELKRSMKRILEAYLVAMYDQAGATITLPKNSISETREIVMTVPVPKELAKNFRSRARKRPNSFGIKPVLSPVSHLGTTGEEIKNYIFSKIRHFGLKRFYISIINQVVHSCPEAKNWINGASHSLLHEDQVVSLNINLEVPNDYFGDPMELIYSRHVENTLTQFLGMPVTVTLTQSRFLSREAYSLKKSLV